MTISVPEKINIKTSTEIISGVGENPLRVKPSLTENALKVLRARYLKKDNEGKVIEEPEDMFLRVAKVIAGAEDLFGNTDAAESAQTVFYNMMASGEFLPNSPTLMNAGREMGQLSACFVLPVEDSMESIFQSLKDAALIHKSGGGTGFSFSRLRPKNDTVRSTKGISSGPVSFMTVFDTATETIKQGGTRRGANMGVLRVDHPDIMDFITCKRDNKSFCNFNISVAVTNEFMMAVRDNKKYNLINPRNGKTVQTVNTRDVFNLIVDNAHKTGDPGIIFIDRMNEHNPLPKIGNFESTNPCGEQPLMPYESCNLGSINLSKMVVESENVPAIDWEKLSSTVRLAVRFLDNVIEVNKYPIEKIAIETRKNRKIGLGVMGFADMLIKLGIPYDSEEAERAAEQVMKFINSESKAESRHLAELRCAFPNFNMSVYADSGEKPLRNATTTTIAPTGTISIIASCSSGIEPLFALSYTRNVLDGNSLAEFHPGFLLMLKENKVFGSELIKEISGSASVQEIKAIPDNLRKIFRTASDIPIEWHIRIQAAFQRHTDNAVSKTINFPKEASVKDVSDAYMLAWESRLKGITIYRDSSKENQVLTVGGKTEKTQTYPGRSHNNIRLKPRPRPSVTMGTTEKLKTGCGNLYVTVNRDEEGLCEVFCQMGRSGGCTSSQSEAISRLISLALRSGVGIDEVVSQLKGIRCPSPIWHEGKLILSCSDAIGTALARHIGLNNGKDLPGIPILTQDADTMKLTADLGIKKSKRGEMSGVCPDCSGILERAEGCLVCRSCGFSKCG